MRRVCEGACDAVHVSRRRGLRHRLEVRFGAVRRRRLLRVAAGSDRGLRRRLEVGIGASRRRRRVFVERCGRHITYRVLCHCQSCNQKESCKTKVCVC